jgi:hypothetical protein
LEAADKTEKKIIISMQMKYADSDSGQQISISMVEDEFEKNSNIYI